MCQTRCGESQLMAVTKGVTIKLRVNKYLKIGSTVIGAVEPFQFMRILL